MDDKEQIRRERAYKIWEDEGRVDGLHDDHWKRAEDPSELTQQESSHFTKTNQQADDEFARIDCDAGFTTTIRPPSTVSPD